MDFESVTHIWRMKVNYERNQYRFTTNDKTDTLNYLKNRISSPEDAAEIMR